MRSLKISINEQNLSSNLILKDVILKDSILKDYLAKKKNVFFRASPVHLATNFPIGVLQDVFLLCGQIIRLSDYQIIRLSLTRLSRKIHSLLSLLSVGKWMIPYKKVSFFTREMITFVPHKRSVGVLFQKQEKKDKR